MRRLFGCFSALLLVALLLLIMLAVRGPAWGICQASADSIHTSILSPDNSV